METLSPVSNFILLGERMAGRGGGWVGGRTNFYFIYEGNGISNQSNTVFLQPAHGQTVQNSRSLGERISLRLISMGSCSVMLYGHRDRTDC